MLKKPPAEDLESTQTEPSQAPPLLLISIDGFRHDYMERTELRTLKRLARDGLKADSLQQIFPTKTFATHYALATGLYADHSGVVANNMWDPDRRSSFSLGNRDAVGDGYWYDGEPIWNTLEKAGRPTATYFWPGSEAQVGGIRPTIWMPYAGDTPHDERIEQVLSWLDQPGAEQPDFLTLYFSIVDDVGHRFGPDDERVNQAMQEVDRALGLLLDGLEQRELLNAMHILITSDHGMQEIDLDRYVMLDDYIDLNQVHVSDWGPAAQIWASEDGLSADQIFAALDGAHPNMRVWKKADTPPRYHFSNHKRVPDVVAEADLGWMISSKPYYAGMERGLLNGMHGWDPAWHTMHGIFIAHGPAFKAGSRLPAVRSIDLYSLMAELMQVEAADTDGSLTAFEPLLYSAEPTQIRSSDWICDDTQLLLREGPASASLQIGQRVFSLPRIRSASGARYEDVDVMFWSKGDQAQVEVDSRQFENCRNVTQTTH
ncbi:MAG: alkaline phosphatase family protein [Pseudomonadota bacterium]